MTHRIPSLSLGAPTVALTTLSLILAVGCASELGGDAPATDGLRPSAASGKADGVGARAYFEQFVYGIDEGGGFYASGNPRWTYKATLWDEHPEVASAESGPLRVDVSLWLVEDGTAYVEYAEQQYEGGGWVHVADQVVRTTWTVENERLEILGVGYGEAALYLLTSGDRTSAAQVPAIRIHFEDDIVSPGLSGQSGVVLRVRTSARLEHVENDYALQEAG